MKRIHIVGAGPRTGTTLMSVLMTTCFDIDLYSDKEKRIFSFATEKGNIYLTKHPRDIPVVGPLMRANPDLYVIFMLRDPRDIITSKHKKAPDIYWASLRFWNHNIKYYKKLKDHPRLITIRYEELVKNADKVQKELIQRMPFLNERKKFSQYHLSAETSENYAAGMKGVRPVSYKSVNKWKNHLPRVAGQLKIHGDITSDLIEFGYEKDHSWKSLLENVEPDFSESHFPDFLADCKY